MSDNKTDKTAESIASGGLNETPGYMLKPCPFCGQPPLLMQTIEDHYSVGCNNPCCEVKPATFEMCTPQGEMVIEVWNNRDNTAETKIVNLINDLHHEIRGVKVIDYICAENPKLITDLKAALGISI